MKKLYYIFFFIGFAHVSFGQITDVRTNYELAFDEMHQMLKGEIPISFKRAVFLTENAYLENQISYAEFQKAIEALTNLTKAVVAADGLDYKKKDRKQVLLAGSIYRVMKDTLVIENPLTNTSFKKYPYTYDTADFWGENDWTKMFVTKLLYTQSGNCHSLPVLYKILADELGAEAYLSITPNHTYIKQWNDKTGWYNTELTSGRFPYDAEIKNNSYIKHEAIVNGVYMDTLTVKENISYAINDLAQGYIKKFGYDDIETPVRWLEVALVYYPDFPNALILKSELLKKRYESLATEKGEKDFLKPKDGELKNKFEELEKSYYSVHQIEYRRMPKEMYLNWLYRVRKDTTRKPHRFESPQPFKDYNYKVTVMTASDGYNYEFYDQEDTTRIGTVIINRLTGKIVKFVDPSKDDFPDEVISRMYDPYVGRFWHIDPLADHPNQFSLSPYNAFWNNPVRYTDPDGRCPDCPTWWDWIKDTFGFGNFFGGGSNDPEVLSQQAHNRARAQEVGNRIENLYQAQKDVMTILPGMTSVYNMFEANRGLQTNGEAALNMSFNAAIDLAGGSLIKYGGKMVAIQVHHLIPESLLQKGNEVVLAAVEGGFKMQGNSNKIPLAKFVKETGEGVHGGRHPVYTGHIEEQITNFSNTLRDAGEKLTPERARTFLESLMNKSRQDIISNPTTKINDLYKKSN